MACVQNHVESTRFFSQRTFMDMADGCEDGPISVSRKTKKGDGYFKSTWYRCWNRWASSWGNGKWNTHMWFLGVRVHHKKLWQRQFSRKLHCIREVGIAPAGSFTVFLLEAADANEVFDDSTTGFGLRQHKQKTTRKMKIANTAIPPTTQPMMRPKLVEDFVVDEAIVLFPETEAQVVEFAVQSAEFPGVYLCQSLHIMLLDEQFKEEIYSGTRLRDVGSYGQSWQRISFYIALTNLKTNIPFSSQTFLGETEWDRFSAYLLEIQARFVY